MKFARARMPPKNWRILIADAGAGERARLIQMLRSDPTRICMFEEASCAVEAMDLVVKAGLSDATRFDCALIDFDLPGMQTADLIDAISGDDGSPRCPVVVLSVDPSQQASSRMLRAGAQDFLGKSWANAPVLLRTVENAVERWAMTRELSAHAESLRKSAASSLFRSALIEATRKPGDSVVVRSEATRVIGQHLGANRVLFSDVSDSGEFVVTPHFTMDVREPVGPHGIDTFGSHAIEELRSGNTVVATEVSEDPAFSPQQKAWLEKWQIAAFAMIPIQRSGRLTCVLSIQQSTPRNWTPDELALAREAAESSWEAIERARAQERLHASEARYQLAMDAGKMGVWWWRPQTSEAAWDANAAFIFGLPRCDDFSMNASDRFFAGVDPEDALRVRADVERILREGGHYRHEFRYTRADDGRHVWLAGYAMTVPDPSGQPDHLVGVNMEITEQKQVEEKLQQSEQRLGQLIAQLPSFTAVLRGPEQVFELANAAYYALVGRGEEIIGKRLLDVMPEMHDQPFPRILDEVYTTGKAYSANNMMARVRRNNVLAEVAIDFVYDPLRSSDGQVTGILVHGVERTEQLHSQRALDRARRELQTITDNLPDMVVRVDSAMRLVFVNAAVEKATGVPRERLLGRTGVDAGLSAEVFSTWSQGLTRVFATGRSETIEYESEAEGVRRQYSTRIVPERSDGGDIDTVLCITQDVTERRQLLQDLIDQDRRKDEFIATLAHELRNPLAPLRTGLQVLELSESPHTQKRTLNTMKRQLGQMVRLIDDLLDLSRISSGKIVLQRERIDLRAVVDMALESVRPLIDAAQHRVEVMLPPEPVWLDADLTRVSQIVLNLLTNAAKYTSPGGRIRVMASREDGEAVIAVTDTGMGIPPDMLERVFDMFTQVNRTLDRAQGGLGIGLALVRRLAHMHGGTITAFSEGDQQGSTFTLKLPVAVELKNDACATALEPIGSGANSAKAEAPAPHRVLIVDDNVDGAETLALMLELSGYATRAAFSGQSALHEANIFQPEVVFLDIGLPGMNGYEVARRFRADPVLAHCTLVALTGWGTEDDQRRSREAGFDMHLTKPVESATIERVLVELLAASAPLHKAEKPVDATAPAI
jgi:PAS domain S-box-containing protein